MNRIILKSKVGSDGVLHLDLPLGSQEADREVQVTVEPTARLRMNQNEWQDWVRSMAGTLQGSFNRPPQGEYERRESLS